MFQKVKTFQLNLGMYNISVRSRTHCVCVFLEEYTFYINFDIVNNKMCTVYIQLYKAMIMSSILY